MCRTSACSAAPVNLALVLERAGHTDEACATYSMDLEVHPEHIPAMQALSRLQLRAGRTDDRTPARAARRHPGVARLGEVPAGPPRPVLSYQASDTKSLLAGESCGVLPQAQSRNRSVTASLVLAGPQPGRPSRGLCVKWSTTPFRWSSTRSRCPSRFRTTTTSMTRWTCPSPTGTRC